jgi:hypothetical protein
MKTHATSWSTVPNFAASMAIALLLAALMAACGKNEVAKLSNANDREALERVEAALKAMEEKEAAREAERVEAMREALEEETGRKTMERQARETGLRPSEEIGKHEAERKVLQERLQKSLPTVVHGMERSGQQLTFPAPVPDNSNLESYSVNVSATKHLKIPGPEGELKVWIGISGQVPETQPDMAAETKDLGAVGETARVEPFTRGITVEPKVSVCLKIDPSGSEVRFKLIPSESGTFSVGANVELYNSADCSGPPVPKTAKSVEVEVTVDEFGVVTSAMLELLKAAWEAFKTFWDKLLILVFALILFLVRKKLFKWFGFGGKE